MDCKYVEHFYINMPGGVERLESLTGLCVDEVETLVGRFNKNSMREGQLRGEVVVDYLGNVKIRHAFTKKIIWES